MDAVRVSTEERKDLRYMGDYYESRKSSTIEDCRQDCISNLDCRAWSYRHLPYGSPGTTIFNQTTPQCLLTNTLKMNEAQVEISPGSVSGLVEYQKIPDYGKIIMWIGILAVILFVVWYLLVKVDTTKYRDAIASALNGGDETYSVVVEESIVLF